MFSLHPLPYDRPISPPPPPTQRRTRLQVKLSPRGIHFLPLVEPFILPKLRIERTLLQPPHLHRESRTELLQSRLGLLLPSSLVDLPRALLEHVTMMPDKYEIALIVKSGDLPSTELRVVREETTEEAPGAMTEPGGESVQVQLRYVGGRRSVVGDVRRRYDVGHLEEGSGTAEAIPGLGRTEVRYKHAVADFALLGQHDEMGEFAIGTEGANLLDRVRLAGVVEKLGYEPHQVGYEVEQLRGRTRPRR